MADVSFIRLAEVINKKEDKRMMSITVKPTITDCSGTIWFTDLMLQEGPALTGYMPHTEICLAESENDPVWFNGIVRSEETVILLNLGGTSAGLDIHLYPKQDMDGSSVTLAQGVGGQKATFPNAMYAGDNVALLASTRECTRNGSTETKEGFYQYSAAWDSKPSCPCRRENPRSFCIPCRKWRMEEIFCDRQMKFVHSIDKYPTSDYNRSIRYRT